MNAILRCTIMYCKYYNIVTPLHRNSSKLKIIHSLNRKRYCRYLKIIGDPCKISRVVKNSLYITRTSIIVQGIRSVANFSKFLLYTFLHRNVTTISLKLLVSKTTGNSKLSLFPFSHAYLCETLTEHSNIVFLKYTDGNYSVGFDVLHFNYLSKVIAFQIEHSF